MGRAEYGFYFILFQLLILGVISQDRVLVDVDSDIPKDGTWEVDCDDGYAELSTDFDCAPDNGGTIDISPGELNGEKGFWTQCSPYSCRIKYHVQPGDTLVKARIYQSDVATEVSFDGVRWDYINGKGWVVLQETLGDAGKNVVSLRFSHFSPTMFNILDKIVINGDFDTPTTTTTTTTTTKPTTTRTTTEPTTITTSEATTETTTEEESLPTTTSPECPTTPPLEPCNCCDRCPERIREIHHHHYYPPSTKFNE